MLLTGTVVVVTGASQGIGRALARGFAADGAHVIVFARNEEALLETTDGDLDHFLPVVGDISSESDVNRLVTTAHDRFGRIDVLVNNASITNTGELLARPFTDWAAVIQVNLLGLASCTYRVLPGMIERGYGRIINLVSRAPEFPQPTLSAYATSKAGVIGFTQALSVEITSPDIRINAQIPGPTETDMYRDSGLDPSSLQPPEAVYPHTRFLVTLPAGGPHGRVFWDSQEYRMYAQTNEQAPTLLRPNE